MGCTVSGGRPAPEGRLPGHDGRRVTGAAGDRVGGALSWAGLVDVAVRAVRTVGGVDGTVTTERLVLTVPTEADLDGLHALHADPAVWEHLPSRRHVDRAQTVALVDRELVSWREHGLGSWVVRSVDDPTGPLLGLAGCRWHVGPAWNLGYRFARACWGRGLASEVVSAALVRAAAVAPDLPVVAYLVEHNTGSRRTAGRAGLMPVWRGPDVGNPDPAAVRLVMADRPVSGAVLTAFIDAP